MIQSVTAAAGTASDRKGHIIMLDLVETNAAARMQMQDGDTYTARHHNPSDVSLYEQFAGIKRVPLEAMLPRQLDAQYLESEQTVEEPVRLDNYSALMNTTTGALLDTRPISKHYALVPHAPVFEEQARQLEASEMPTNNVEVLDRVYGHGKRVHRTIVFHDLQQAVTNRAGIPDAVRCRMDIFNSVDMSWAFQIFSGAYRDLCRNTLVFGGQKAYHQRKIHKGDISPAAMIAKATNGLEHWSQNSEQMKLWQQVGITDKQFGDILKETICHKKTKAADVDAKLAINERRLNWLLERFNEEKAELGSTMWGAYNALTHYATHLPMSRDSNNNREMVASRRNNEVRAVIDSPSWQYLEGIAA
jgi:hypothetical protein